MPRHPISPVHLLELGSTQTIRQQTGLGHETIEVYAFGPICKTGSDVPCGLSAQARSNVPVMISFVPFIWTFLINYCHFPQFLSKFFRQLSSAKRVQTSGEHLLSL
ncbi:hypothetical protein SAMN04515647_0254 [Cohaesibacter sp. ES.047]|nr:hypothetical protein SAMN04515647_0254 [Cohaesibacter sp. ES.047]